MKATIPIYLSFSVPATVRAGFTVDPNNHYRSPPMAPNASTVPTGCDVHLSQLDVATLEALCSEFKAEVFKKAGKRIPAHPMAVEVREVNKPSAEMLTRLDLMRDALIAVMDYEGMTRNTRDDIMALIRAALTKEYLVEKERFSAAEKRLIIFTFGKPVEAGTLYEP